MSAAPPPSVKNITKDVKSAASFDRWLYNFWTQQNTLSALLTNGTPGQVVGLDEDGNLALLTLDGGDDFTWSISGTTISISLSEDTVQQLVDMKLVLEKMFLEQQKLFNLLAKSQGKAK